MGGPGQGAPAALSVVFTLLARHWNGIGQCKALARPGGKTCIVGGRGGGGGLTGRILACSGFLWAGGGHGSALQFEIKEGSTAPPSWPPAAT